MRLKVDIKGIDGAVKELNKLNLVKTKQVKDLVHETALNVMTEARKVVPVDNSGLKNSIRILHTRMDKLGMEVGSDLPYAAYIEYGEPTGTGPNGGPRPYLNPAAEKERKRFNKELKKIFKK